MKRTYTDAERKAIVDAHIEEYGRFDPAEFIAAAKAEQHPAHDWFEWDDAVGGDKWRLHQARQFVQVTVVHEVGEHHGVEISAPAFVAQEMTGDGGYLPFEQSTDELRAQMVSGHFSYQALLKRYSGVMHDKEIKAAKALIRMFKRGSLIKAA